MHRPSKPASGDPAQRLAARVARALARTPEFDARRVAQVRAALAAGGYRINPERIAQRLIEAELTAVHRPA